MLESGLLSEIIVLNRVTLKKKNAKLTELTDGACFLTEIF